MSRAGGRHSAQFPLVTLPAVWYLAFVVASLAVWRMLFFFWPYPLILCVQKWIPGTVWVVGAAWALGLGSVLLAGATTQRLFGSGRPRIWLAILISPVVVAIPLTLIQLTAWAVAASLGWPYGE